MARPRRLATGRAAVNKAIASKLLQTLEKCEYIFRHGNNFLLTHKINNLSVRQLDQQRLLEQATAALKPLIRRKLIRITNDPKDARARLIHLQTDPDQGQGGRRAVAAR